MAALEESMDNPLSFRGETATLQGSLAEALSSCILAVDHVAVAVPELSVAIDWYVKKLGFRLLETRLTHGEHTAMKSAVVVAGAAVVVLIQGTSPKSQVSRFIEHFGPGVQHVAFCVQDLDVALERLASSGGSVATPLLSTPGLRQVFLTRDEGSGVRIELIERRGGEFSDESVARLFRDFETRDLY
jgi:catechol 2,3-dioxygenase-like lactoylglutathione lyase family enzyme